MFASYSEFISQTPKIYTEYSVWKKLFLMCLWLGQYYWYLDIKDREVDIKCFVVININIFSRLNVKILWLLFVNKHLFWSKVLNSLKTFLDIWKLWQNLWCLIFQIPTTSRAEGTLEQNIFLPLSNKWDNQTKSVFDWSPKNKRH